jgi:hypothetical protein
MSAGCGVSVHIVMLFGCMSQIQHLQACVFWQNDLFGCQLQA